MHDELQRGQLEILARLEPAPVQPTPSVDPAVLAGYLRWVEQTHGRLRGFVSDGKRVPEIKLEEAFVALRADAVRYADRMEGHRNFHSSRGGSRALTDDEELRWSEQNAYSRAHSQRNLRRSFAPSAGEPVSLGRTCREH